jgi:ribose transport system permease protein
MTTIGVVKGALAPDVSALASRLIGVLLLSLALALLSDAFLTTANLLNVLRQASLVFLLASGLTFVILAAGLDLSIGANVTLSACIAATVMQATGAIVPGVAAGLLCGTAIGMTNGALVTWLRLPPFIATYGMLWVVHGVSYWYMGGQTIYGFPESFRAIGSGHLAGIPVPVYLMAGTLVAGGLFARHTTWGHEIYAIGANREAARLSGIPVTRRLHLVYILSGAMAGLASMVYLARLNSAEADMGEPLLLPAIAAVLIGGTSLFGGGSLGYSLSGARSSAPLLLTLVINGNEPARDRRELAAAW